MVNTKTMRAYDAYRTGQLSKDKWQLMVKKNGLNTAMNMSVTVGASTVKSAPVRKTAPRKLEVKTSGNL